MQQKLSLGEEQPLFSIAVTAHINHPNKQLPVKVIMFFSIRYSVRLLRTALSTPHNSAQAAMHANSVHFVLAPEKRQQNHIKEH